MTALAPAIANAIYHAIGVRIYDGFLSPDNILRAIEKAKQR
jgi:CO/xanthine dehydrogenase Mo-binding subunit